MAEPHIKVPSAFFFSTSTFLPSFFYKIRTYECNIAAVPLDLTTTFHAKRVEEAEREVFSPGKTLPFCIMRKSLPKVF